MGRFEFDNAFESLTSYKPFPWQRRLYHEWFTGKPTGQNFPEIADLPTGLGKTSIIAVWLLALMEKPDKVPRRLVYVVNRRTVVDQTTAEVQRLRENLPKLNDPRFRELAISTLRGQYADNEEWSADPSRPAVICGTVDMIGSRLLFEGYRIGFRSRPLHAGFLGQDALLVHDEAHLEPAFQQLIERITKEQHEVERTDDLPWPRLRVMALSATARNNTDNGKGAFELTDKDRENDIVQQRIGARKMLALHPCEDEKKGIVDEIVNRALEFRESGDAVLVFLHSVANAMDVADALTKRMQEDTIEAAKASGTTLKKDDVPETVATLTGTMRGYERDELVKSNQVFARFMPAGDRPKDVTPAESTVYLVCTSAGEVGVNISADHMVCDLSTFDSMAQRLGRVNRFGNRDNTQVDVVYPESFDEKHPLTPSRKATLELLQQLDGDASPKALGDLPADQRLAAFAPEPTILPATDILFDAWALTTIKGKMPGRPPVAPYLHGVAEWEPPRTSVAWRDEVEVITDELLEREGEDFPQQLLADYPLKPHELLSDRTDRVLEALQKLAKKHSDARVWLVDKQGEGTIRELCQLANPSATKKPDKERLQRVIADGIVLLPPSVGGLSAGMLNAESERADDIADHWFDEDENSKPRRARVWDNEEHPEGMALIRTIDTDPLADENAPPDEEAETSATKKRFWQWYARPHNAENATRASARPIKWQHHTDDVVDRARQIVNDLQLPDELRQAVILAAELHDLGKQREIWQRSIGNPNPTHLYAKSGRRGSRYEPDETKRWLSGFRFRYRHEFGSLLDALDSEQQYRAKLDDLNEDMRDVVLHLIAAHHGYARPHFLPEGTIDPDTPSSVDAEAETIEVMRRYARLQRKYGRWGLAYLESLLRAADWAASANPSDNGGVS